MFLGKTLSSLNGSQFAFLIFWHKCHISFVKFHAKAVPSQATGTSQSGHVCMFGLGFHAKTLSLGPGMEPSPTSAEPLLVGKL